MSAQEVDEYLAGVDESQRPSLQTLRQTILEILPEAEQAISYGLPAFRVRGKTIAGFAAFKTHLSYLPFSGSVLGQLDDELDGYTMTKSSLHFSIERPLSKALVRKRIAPRLAEAGLEACRARQGRTLGRQRLNKGAARSHSRASSSKVTGGSPDALKSAKRDSWSVSGKHDRETEMSTTVDATTQASAVEEFMGTVGIELAAAASAALAILGDRLGLFKELSVGGPMTSSELAARTGCAERYVREWLANQAAGNWIAYDEETERFALPAAHAAVIADESSPAFLGGSLQVVGAMYRSLDILTEAFRTGEGIGWGEHHSDLHEGAARFFRTACQAYLPTWIESLEGVASRLTAGGRVADLGCGQGGAAIAIAKAFPAAKVVGLDTHGPSIERARAAAAAAGVADRVAFRIADASELDRDAFDLVTMLDCLHDMGDPVAAAGAACVALSEGGALLLVEPASGDRLSENFNPTGRMYYASSTAFCTPCALSQEGGWALGNQAGESRLRDVCDRAGLGQVRIAARTPFQLVLEARP